MDKSSNRSNQLDLRTGTPLPFDFGDLSPNRVVFRHSTMKLISPKKVDESELQSTDISNNAEKEEAIVGLNESDKTENFKRGLSRDDTIRMNLEKYQIYISNCVKPDDITLRLQCFSEEQKSDVESEKNLIKASRRAISMLLLEVDGPGRFAALRDALDTNDAYPKIVRILDGDYDPEDQNYVKVVELFTPEIIVRLNPAELMPHLLSKGVFKQIDFEEIRAEEKNHGKMRASCVLLMYLPRRIVDWFRSFLEALIECGLDDIAEMLDPDLFKAISHSQQSLKFSDIRKANGSKIFKEKPTIPPKPQELDSKYREKLRKSSEEVNDTETKAPSVSGTTLEEGRNQNLTSASANKPPEVESWKETDDVIEISDHDVSKVEYIVENVNERETIEECMAECDAKVIWPDTKEGKSKILLKSISKEKTDRKLWLRKRNVWKHNVMLQFKQYLEQTIVKKQPQCKRISSSFNKVLRSKDVTRQRHIKPEISKRTFSCREFQNLTLQSDQHKENCEAVPEECFKSIQIYVVCKMPCERRISIVKGSLDALKVDVMVNTTDSHLSLSTGLAETIRQTGGETITEACAKHIQSQRSMDEGEVFVTEAGKLPAKYVIHANSPVWKGGNEQEDRTLRETVMRCMLQASIKNAESIALPAISCGISGFSYKVGTTLIVRAVRNFFREEPASSLRQVFLVDIKSDAVKRFHEALLTVFKDEDKCEIEKL